MKPTLLILAAGMGSRYGGLKQMDAFGPHGETIIDYSIHDAMECGYGKIVFIIRKNFEKEFVKLFEEKIKGRIATEYVTQELEYYMGNYKVPSGSHQALGTAHAVLCGKRCHQGTIAVINADDFYGKDAFLKVPGLLNKEVSPKNNVIVGYELGNTISPYGSVSRCVCEVG